jgi:hypothetical protein
MPQIHWHEAEVRLPGCAHAVTYGAGMVCEPIHAPA